jgi:UDP-N-acetyl-2-amino-2-deoxyglucuronate dehydrogenase
MNINEKKKVIVFGFGRIANKHIIAIQKSGMLLEAVIDPDPVSRARALEHNISEVTADVSDLKRKNFDLAVILTPSGNHFENIIEASNFAKIILCEKPVVLDMTHIAKLSKIEETQGLKIFEVKQNRFNSSTRKFEEILQTSMGAIYSGHLSVKWCRTKSYFEQAPWRGKWSSDGGVLGNQAIHHFDILLKVLGTPTELFSKTKNLSGNLEAEDLSQGLIAFNDICVTFEATTLARPKNIEAKLTFTCENGWIALGGESFNSVTFQTNEMEQPETIPEPYLTQHGDVYGNGHVDLYAEIKRYMCGGDARDLVGVSEAQNTISLISWIYAQCESNTNCDLAVSRLWGK